MKFFNASVPGRAWRREEGGGGGGEIQRVKNF